ncbi:MAG: hypothetical protein HY272_10275 [Gammaproteobacteria bacterium]|nr:hypothetical protein [Gammaproteobacteria bacterium]
MFTGIGLKPLPLYAEEIQTLNVEGMTIYGQRELPKVMYIVPWKKMDTADIDKPTTGSLVADVLDPLNPELFQRQVRYHDLMQNMLASPAR